MRVRRDVMDDQLKVVRQRKLDAAYYDQIEVFEDISRVMAGGAFCHSRIDWRGHSRDIQNSIDAVDHDGRVISECAIRTARRDNGEVRYRSHRRIALYADAILDCLKNFRARSARVHSAAAACKPIAGTSIETTVRASTRASQNVAHTRQVKQRRMWTR